MIFFISLNFSSNCSESVLDNIDSNTFASMNKLGETKPEEVSNSLEYGNGFCSEPEIKLF